MNREPQDKVYDSTTPLSPVDDWILKDGGEAMGCIQRWAACLTLASLIFSYYLMFSGITPQGIFRHYTSSVVEPFDIIPVGGLPIFLIGVLIFGVNLYILRLTDGFMHWNNIPLYKMAIPFILIIVSSLISCVGFLWVILVLFDGYTDLRFRLFAGY